METENNKKYRYTKQLVNMASRDGWTQKQIADACRVQQSVVSTWKSGVKQARENQLKALLDVYGPRLFRKSFKVYHNFILGEHENLSICMIKIEGEVMLTFPYRNKIFCMKCFSELTSCSCSIKIKKMLPTRKIIVHAMGKGEFCLLKQSRILKDQYQMKYPDTNIFTATVIGRFTSQELLNRFGNLDKNHNPEEKIDEVEHLMAQMLLRKSLLEHGYPLEGVEEHLVSC